MTEIAKMLVLSTAHLTPECCNTYLKQQDGPWYEKADYGWFFPVLEAYDEVEGMFPSCLLDCIEAAEQHECTWIMFDRDADTIDGLTVSDWGA